MLKQKASIFVLEWCTGESISPLLPPPQGEKNPMPEETESKNPRGSSLKLTQKLSKITEIGPILNIDELKT